MSNSTTILSQVISHTSPLASEEVAIGNSLPSDSPQDNADHPSHAFPQSLFEHLQLQLHAVKVISRKILRIPYPVTFHLAYSHFLKQPESIVSEKLYHPYIQQWIKQTKLAVTDLEPIYKQQRFVTSINQYKDSEKSDELSFFLNRRLIDVKNTSTIFKKNQNKHVQKLLTALTLLHIMPSTLHHAQHYASELYKHDTKDIGDAMLYALVLQKQKHYQKPLSLLKNLQRHELATPRDKFIALEQISHLHYRHHHLKEAARAALSMVKIAQKENILSHDELTNLLIKTGQLACSAHLPPVALDSCKRLKQLLQNTSQNTTNFESFVHYHTTLAIANSQLNQTNRALTHIETAKNISKKQKLFSAYTNSLLYTIYVAEKANQSDTIQSASKELRTHALLNHLPALAIYCGMIIAQHYEDTQQWNKLLHILKNLVGETQKLQNCAMIVDVLHKLGQTQIQIGDYLAAHDTINHASNLSFTIKEKPQLYQMSCLLTAMLAVRTERMSSAEFWFERARAYSHQVDPIYAASLANLGYLKFQQGKSERATNAWERARNVYRHHHEFDKIQKMNQTIQRLHASKPNAGELLKAKDNISQSNKAYPASLPGPVLTQRGHIKKETNLLFPRYVISNFVLS